MTITHSAARSITGPVVANKVTVAVTELGSSTLASTVTLSRYDATQVQTNNVTGLNCATVTATDDAGNACPVDGFDDAAVSYNPATYKVTPLKSEFAGLTFRSPKYGKTKWQRPWSVTGTSSLATPTWKSGSLMGHVAGNIDTMLLGLTAGAATQNTYASNNYNTASPAVTRNTNLFCKNYDLTGMAVATAQGQFNPPCLISPRHALTCAHWAQPAGTLVSFLGSDGAIYTRTRTATVAIFGTDLALVAFDSALPAVVKPFELLPADAGDYLPISGAGDYATGYLIGRTPWSGDQMYVNRLFSLLPPVIGRQAPLESGAYVSWSHQIISRDSGSPDFLPISGDLVLLWTHYTASVQHKASDYLTEIQAAMNSLATGYTLTTKNLSAFSKFTSA